MNGVDPRSAQFISQIVKEGLVPPPLAKQPVSS
jgi:hypothetical protein